MSLGERFKYFRQKAGLKQKEAAKLIGINNYQLGNYETDRSEPSISVLKKMSQVYNVSIDKLVNNVRHQPLSEEYKLPSVDYDRLIELVNEIVEKSNKKTNDK